MVVEGGAGHCSVTGCAQPRSRKSHECAGSAWWKLELAVPRRPVVAFNVRMAAEVDGDFEAFECIGDHSSGKRIDAACGVSILDRHLRPSKIRSTLQEYVVHYGLTWARIRIETPISFTPTLSRS